MAQASDILRRAADADFGLVLDLEYSHGQPMVDVAKDYPDTTFGILNQSRRATTSSPFSSRNRKAPISPACWQPR